MSFLRLTSANLISKTSFTVSVFYTLTNEDLVDLVFCANTKFDVPSTFVPFQCFLVNCGSAVASRGCDYNLMCPGLLPSGPAVAPIQHSPALLCVSLLRDKQRKSLTPAHKTTVNTFFLGD